MKIKYYGPFAATTGYGRAGSDYISALIKVGVDVSIFPLTDVDTDDLGPQYQWLVPYAQKSENQDFTHIVVHAPTPMAHELVRDDMEPPPHVKRVCLTTWETDSVPPEYVERLNKHFDLVLVPCEENALVYLWAGVKKVEVLYHTFDPTWWYDQPIWNKPVSPYVFYSVLGWGMRKNPYDLLSAYFSEFKASEDVVLKLVLPQNDKKTAEFDIERLKRWTALPLDKLPKVELIADKYLSDEELRQIHRESHCYVTVAHGEGWGLGAFEAALQYNHVIATVWAGLESALKCHRKLSRVPYRMSMVPWRAWEPRTLRPVTLGGHYVEPTPTDGWLPLTVDQKWTEPDISALMKYMRTAYTERYGLPDFMLGPHTQIMTETYSYEKIGARFKKLLEEA